MSNFMFAKYMKEREGAETIQSHKGFICYKIENDYCIITDIYIDKPFRKSSVGSSFGKEVEEIAREKGIKSIYCYADQNALNYDESIEFILKNGYKLENIIGSRILFKKEL